MDLNSYLYDFVNDNEKISNLLEILLDNTESRAGALFTKNNNTYNCVCVINREFPEKLLVNLNSIKIYDVINDTKNNHYNANFDIVNNITIPVKNKDKMLGIISLFNNKNKYDSEKIIYNINY